MYAKLVRPLVLLTLVGMTLPATSSASSPDLADRSDRLLANGDLLGSGRVRNRDGTGSWTLLIDDTFDEAAITALGGAVDWAYPDRGVARVRSHDLAFGDDLVAAGLAAGAVENRASHGDLDEWQVSPATLPGAANPAHHYVNGPDLYAENGFWWFYAIDAAEPVPSDTTVSGWTPQWQLEQDGAGITIGSNDSGGPAEWCEPMDVRVDLAAPLWGVCALWSATLEDEDCVFEDADPLPAAGLCEDLGTLLGNPSTLDGETCALADQSLSEFYALFYGYDYLNLDELSPFFRPRRLNPEYDWYVSAADVAADPTLGDPGGVVPLFDSLEDYRAFYEDRYMQALVPTGITVVNEQLAFAGIEVALTGDFAAALEDGTAGACSTADPRLPDPDALDWSPYTYDLYEPPFHRYGVAPSEGENGYDADGELRVILDPSFGVVDQFGIASSAHGTATAAAMVARYRPDEVYGSLRGLAPGTRFIAYPSPDFWFGVLHGFRRAGDDGVLVLNNSFVSYYFDSRWGRGNADFEEIYFAALEAAAGDASRDVLVVFAAGNEAMDYNALRVEMGFKSLVQSLPAALVVGGTAGRDYDWRGDIPMWMPDAEGRPYDDQRQAFNLDRPMIYYSGAVYSGTNFGAQIDLVAPAGATYHPEGCPESVDCEEQNGDLFFCSAAVAEGGPEEPGSYNVGPHCAGVGTSFAAPLVTGAAALAAQAYQERHGRLPTPGELSRILTRTADDRVGPTTDLVARLDAEATEASGEFVFGLETVPVDKRGPDDWMGNGRLNVRRAIEEAER